MDMSWLTEAAFVNMAVEVRAGFAERGHFYESWIGFARELGEQLELHLRRDCESGSALHVARAMVGVRLILEQSTKEHDR